MHTHLTTTKRVEIAVLRRTGTSVLEIAETVGVHRSTIYRELQRNRGKRGYSPLQAQRKAEGRRKDARVGYRKITCDPVLRKRIVDLLHPLRSPETVGELVGTHHQTIYSWIYRECISLKGRLPRRGVKRKKRGTQRASWVSKTRSIHTRPPTKGLSWEGDTMVGEGLTRLLTHVERRSLYLDVRLIPDGEAETVRETLTTSPLSGQITYDCGSEFTLWRYIERDTNTMIYFCDPHSPYQRGKNENTNGRLRRLFPKKYNFSTLTNRELQKVAHLMNHTPRKSLNWRTPQEVYTEIVAFQSRI